MFCNSIRINTFILILTVTLLPALTAQAQENTPTEKQGASVTLLDSTREQDGLLGSVRRVKVQTAKLEMKAGQPVEGPLQLLELTTYSVGGNRIENISYPVPTTAVGKEEYKYDEKGHIVEMTLRGDDGSILSREKYTYELDTFGNWTKMVTSLIVFEDGQLKFEPVEVTYRTLAYYFNETVAQIVDSDSRPMPAEPKGVTISNSAATKPHAESARPEPVRTEPVKPKPVKTDSVKTEPVKTEPVRTEPVKTEPLPGALRVGKKASSTNDEPEPTENRREISSTADAASVTEARNTAAGPTETAAKAPESPPKTATPAVSAELKMAFEYYKTGRERFDSGAINEAIDAYQNSIKLEPNSAEVHLSLGQAYLKLKQDQQALKSFKRATVLNPEMAEAFYGLGLIHFNQRHHRDAAKAFKQATVASPNMAKAHYGLALAYQELGDENAVVAEFRILETLDRGLAKKLADTFPEFNLPCRVPPYCK